MGCRLQIRDLLIPWENFWQYRKKDAKASFFLCTIAPTRRTVVRLRVAFAQSCSKIFAKEPWGSFLHKQKRMHICILFLFPCATTRSMIYSFGIAHEKFCSKIFAKEPWGIFVHKQKRMHICILFLFRARAIAAGYTASGSRTKNSAQKFPPRAIPQKGRKSVLFVNLSLQVTCFLESYRNTPLPPARSCLCRIRSICATSDRRADIAEGRNDWGIRGDTYIP